LIIEILGKASQEKLKEYGPYGLFEVRSPVNTNTKLTDYSKAVEWSQGKPEKPNDNYREYICHVFKIQVFSENNVGHVWKDNVKYDAHILLVILKLK
jgi:hypothetical protein